jgi:hypothetical protein
MDRLASTVFTRRWLCQTVLDHQLKVFVRAERADDSLNEFPDCVDGAALPDADARGVVGRCGMDRQLDVRLKPCSSALSSAF